MPKKDYDTKEGINKLLDTLEGFYALLRVREKAAKRGVKLHEFIITGYWWLKEDGTYWKTIVGSMFTSDPYPYIAKYRFPEIPDVLTPEELKVFIQKNVGEGEIVEFELQGGNLVFPHPAIPCKICRRKFTGRDAYDFVEHESRENPYLDDFVGKTFGEYRVSLKESKAARYRVIEMYKIRHPRFIDMSQNKYSRPKNSAGIRGDRDGITDDYVIQKGDRTSLERFDSYHKICHFEALAVSAKREFTVLLVQAGFDLEVLWMNEVPNRYGSRSWMGPWFEVETTYGPILIGWRKRVINISWRGLGRDMMHLFDDIENTKEDDSIHAWTYDEAVEILRRIRQALYGDGQVTEATG